MGGLAIVLGKDKPKMGADEEPTSERYSASEEDGDEFSTGFEAFRSAIKSGDAAKGKKALRLMMAACEDEEEM